MTIRCGDCGATTALFFLFDGSDPTIPDRAICISCFKEQCTEDLKRKFKEKLKETFTGETFMNLAKTFTDSFKNVDYKEFGEYIWVELEPKMKELIESYGLGLP